MHLYIMLCCGSNWQDCRCLCDCSLGLLNSSVCCPIIQNAFCSLCGRRWIGRVKLWVWDVQGHCINCRGLSINITVPITTVRCCCCYVVTQRDVLRRVRNSSALAKKYPANQRKERVTTLSLTIRVYHHSFNCCCCLPNLRNLAKLRENSNL